MRPTLVVNPAGDALFADRAHLISVAGATSVTEFQRRLRLAYPSAVVHVRQLSGEPVPIWYVYRDGHWVHP